jgi:glycosyltransferase involved in cell wall biosynthesis
MPAVSVVIPSFNRGHCIRACIESVLAQSFQDLEVIVVDDASNDDTRGQVMSVDDPRVRYIAHERNRGGSAARNTGIQASHCEFVAFLDSDDLWAPRKLEKQLQLLQVKGEEYGFVYAWCIANTPDGKEVWRMHKTIDGLAAVELLVENCVGTFSGVVARRNVLTAVGGLDEKMRSCQDWDLFVRLNSVTKVCCVEEYLVIYLQNSNDRHRISANPASIVMGHRRMLQKLEMRYPAMPAEARAGSLRGFSRAFSAAGSVGDVLRTGMRMMRAVPSVANFLILLRMLAGSMKRSLTRNLGY